MIRLQTSIIYFTKNVSLLPACTQCASRSNHQAVQTENVRLSTVDQDDVDRHTKLMNEWWNPSGPMKALHSYNELRVPFVRDGLVNFAPEERTCTPLLGKNILDVGCGGGILSEALARLGANVTGIDASKELIDLAQKHSQNDPKIRNKLTYYSSPIEDHAQKFKEHYDGVVASEIIEHIDNDKKELFIKSCVSTLKPNGRIFFTTPAKSRLSQATVICLTEYVFNLVPCGTHQFEKFMTPNELTFLVERSGCHVEMILGIFYNVLQNKWSFINNQSLVFALQAVKLTEKTE